MKKLLATAAATAAILAASNAYAGGHSIKIGLMATLEGTYTVLGEDGVRGAKTALAAFGGAAASSLAELKGSISSFTLIFQPSDQTL